MFDEVFGEMKYDYGYVAKKRLSFSEIVRI